jgi:hypothetical protein
MPLTKNDLTAAIETVMAEEYAAKMGTPLPAAGAEDRKLLFTAIAGGILQYLESKQNEVITTIKLKEVVSGSTEKSHTVTGLDLNITL